MPAALPHPHELDAATDSRLGPRGPFPRAPMTRPLERRWLHYAFVSRDLTLGLVSNLSWLGPDLDDPLRRTRSASILLLHHVRDGWSASQFNGVTAMPAWSAFRQPSAHGDAQPFEIASTAGAPAVRLRVTRSGRPCTSQCASFADDQHLRWQSEPGVLAHGEWRLADRVIRDVSAVGYHERVRGVWGWPELGEWVFGFANDASGDPSRPPAWAAVFTFIRPRTPEGATTASVMLWQDGRLRRHFPRRNVSMAVRGTLDRNHVRQVPALANLLGVPPMRPIPRRLVIEAHQGADRVVLDFESEAAARVVIASETSLRPFSVHEVIGPCRLEGSVGGRTFALETRGIVEFAGGADADR